MKIKNPSKLMFSLLVILDRPKAYFFFWAGIVAPILMLYFIVAPDVMASVWSIVSPDLAEMIRQGKEEMENSDPLATKQNLDVMVAIASPVSAILISQIVALVVYALLFLIAGMILRRDREH